jgi:urease accessory protein
VTEAEPSEARLDEEGLGGARCPQRAGRPATLIGHLKVRASPDGQGRTHLSEQSFRAPFHIGKGYWDGQVMQLRVVNPTAGILAGDRLELAVDVDSGASLAILTPAATRAFMMTSGVAACEQRFTVAADAWLEYSPEPLFPHTQSDYCQATRLELAAGAQAYYAEALAPGRVGRGESWAWKRLRLSLDVTVGGKLLFRERLDSSGADFARLAAFYRTPEAWFATVVLYSERLRDDSPVWNAIRTFGTPTRLAVGLYLVRVIASGSIGLRDALVGLRDAAAGFFSPLQTDLRRQ